ncbi:hypothetical protein [Ramlibacter sp. 2FC]|uniref:hypothetical protein n=1 Tax=Ramlibacter sp. 2FC TaxID=2502188 RepID=UPI0010F74A00|nr:hypothetical protein [Ramlibacter sp. 2FC]
MATSSTIKRLQALLWVLIYGGLLTLVLGLAVQRVDEPLGWSLVVVGGLVAAAGFALIYLRAKLREDR